MKSVPIKERTSRWEMGRMPKWKDKKRRRKTEQEKEDVEMKGHQ